MFNRCSFRVAATVTVLGLFGLAVPAVWAQVPVPAPNPTPEQEQLLAAVRKSDVATVKALLDKGVDVNTKFKYGATALFPACDRGNVEIVKLLLDHGAQVNVKDTFYGASPMTWAVDKGHAEIIKMLLDKGAEGREEALMRAAAEGNVVIAQVILDKGVKPDTLSSALAAAKRNGKTEVAELLKKAGAAPPPPADFKVSEETLKKYLGAYRHENGQELVFSLKDGKFVSALGSQQFNMQAFDNVTFRPEGLDGITVTFQFEGDKVTGLVVKEPGSESRFKRVEGKP